MAITRSARAFLLEVLAKYQLNSPSLAGLELDATDPEPALRDLFGKLPTWDTKPIAQVDELVPAGAAYDLVVAVETFGTVQTPAAVIDVLTDIVKPAGYVILSVRVYGGAPDPGDRPDKPTGLFWKFHPGDFATLFKFAGFEVLEVQMDNLLPGVFVVAQRRLRDLAPLVGMGAYRDGDEVPDIPQTYV